MIKSDLDDPEEPNLINSEDGLELGFDWSAFVDPDFDWPERFAARLASPLRGLAAPCIDDSFRDDVDWNKLSLVVRKPVFGVSDQVPL